MRKYLVTTLGLASILFYSEIGYCDSEVSKTVTVSSCSLCDAVCKNNGGVVEYCSAVKGKSEPQSSSVTVSGEVAGSCNGTSCTGDVNASTATGGSYSCQCKGDE